MEQCKNNPRGFSLFNFTLVAVTVACVQREVQYFGCIRLCNFIILLPCLPRQLTLQEVACWKIISKSLYSFKKVKVGVTQHFSCKKQKPTLANLSRKGTD